MNQTWECPRCGTIWQVSVPCCTCRRPVISAGHTIVYDLCGACMSPLFGHVCQSKQETVKR